MHGDLSYISNIDLSYLSNFRPNILDTSIYTLFTQILPGLQSRRGGSAGPLEVRGQHQAALLPHEASREGTGRIVQSALIACMG